MKWVGVALAIALISASPGFVAATSAVTPDSDGLTPIEELRAGLNPFDADTDNDGLPDDLELDLPTDATDPDTDDDGLPDGPELRDHPALPGADPLRKDVYVEIDVMAGVRLPRDDLHQVVQVFADAPVSNPDGSRGIELHLVFDDRVPRAATTNNSDFFAARGAYADRRTMGYHYALLVAEIEGNTVGRCLGAGFMVETRKRGAVVASVFMHELGHTLGLGHDEFRGIDSDTVSFADYPSAMSYNAPDAHLGYSTGDAGPRDFDDWEHVEDHVGVRVTFDLPTGRLRMGWAAERAFDGGCLDLPRHAR